MAAGAGRMADRTRAASGKSGSEVGGPEVVLHGDEARDELAVFVVGASLDHDEVG